MTRLFPRLSPYLISSLVVATASACPAPSPTGASRGGPKEAKIDANDERVEALGTDLYPKGNAPNLDSQKRKMATGGRIPGAGVPDETNGTCRLFDPHLPEPECCPFESGFDVGDLKATCGDAIYLGEAFYHSCAYHFTRDPSTPPVTIRVAPILGLDVAKAVAAHDVQLARVTKDPKFKSTPVPGVSGAFWSRSSEGLNWAFIPGWSTARRVAWKDDACDREDMAKLIKKLASAKEPAKDAERPGLLPERRK